MRFRIKELRENRKLTQEELAEMSGVSRANIVRLESEEDTVTTTDTLNKLAKALGVTVKYLILP